MNIPRRTSLLPGGLAIVTPGPGPSAVPGSVRRFRFRLFDGLRAFSALGALLFPVTIWSRRSRRSPVDARSEAAYRLTPAVAVFSTSGFLL